MPGHMVMFAQDPTLLSSQETQRGLHVTASRWVLILAVAACTICFLCGSVPGEAWASSSSGVLRPPLFPLTRPVRRRPIVAAAVTKEAWDDTAQRFWTSQPPTVGGVLGGLNHVNDADINASLAFLAPFAADWGPTTVALDCGAGVGRVSNGVLLPLVGRIELQDFSDSMLAAARNALPADRVAASHHCRLQDFAFPATPTYAMIVMQWLLMYITDDDIIGILQRARRSLTPDGLIFVKDNVSRGATSIKAEDSSMARSEAHYDRLFRLAGLRMVTRQRQSPWPLDLHPVMMYALR